MPLTPLPRDKGRLKLGGRSGNRHAEGTAEPKRGHGRDEGRESGRSSSRAAKSRGGRETERTSRANDFLRRFHPVGGDSGKQQSRNARRGEDGPSLLVRMGAGLAARSPSVGGFLAILAAMLQIAFAGLVVVAALCVITLGLFVGYRWTTSLERFAIREVVVQGAVRQTEADILAATGVEGPTNLLELNLRDVEAGVAALPWTESVSVRRELPDKLLVSVVEKTPVFFVQRKEGIYYADALGRIIAPVPSAGTTGAGAKADDVQALREALPRLEMGEGAERFATALPEVLTAFGVEVAGREAIRRALPPAAGAAGVTGTGMAASAGQPIRPTARMPFELKDVALIRLSAKNGLEFTLDDPPVSVSLGAVDWREQLPRVAVVLEDLRRRGELDRVAAIRAYGEAALVERLDKVDRPENRLDRLEVQTEPKPQAGHAPVATGVKTPESQKPGDQKPGDKKPQGGAPEAKQAQKPVQTAPQNAPDKAPGAKVR